MVQYTGMYIRLEHVHELGGLGFFVYHQIPICYLWGDEEENYVKQHPAYACYRPPASVIKAALARKNKALGIHSNTSDADLMDFSLDPFPIEDDLEIDRPPTPSSSSSLHVLGVSIQSFQEERRAINRAKEERQTPEARLLRQARVQTRNTPIFYWRENSNGQYIRLQVSSRYRASLEDKLVGYKRHYDQFYDEADYAFTFDPHSEDFEGTQRTFASSDLARLDRQMRDAHRRRIPELREPERIEEDWSRDCAVDIACNRLGFIRKKDSVSSSQKTADDLWDKINHCLQMTGLPDTCPPDVLPFAQNLVQFLHAFKPLANEDGYCPDAQQWDANPISTALNSSLAVGELERLGPKHVRVGQAEGLGWSLVVLNDVDALHACRLRDLGMSVRDVAWHFLDRGIPCRTMIRHTRPHRVLRLHPPAIELRIGGYRFDESDYHSYRRNVRSILSRPGVAFAAFKHGGIVWRIAREEYGKLGATTFEAGPDLTEIADISSEVPGWVDNELLPEEIAGLCGVYHVPSGEAEVAIFSFPSFLTIFIQSQTST